MSQRLSTQPGEWIDRGRTLRFRFEDRPYSAFAGDTISSALAAHGVRLLGRSFKYHRPRGIYTMSNHDVNVMLHDGTRTNIRGDVTPVRDGGEYWAVNTFGGVDADRARFTDAFGRFLPVGFYYKTFHKPRKWFPYFERKMREMAGLGTIDPKAPRTKTPKDYDWCDVLVIGGGPAGLSAAIAAAEAAPGAQVVIVDEHPRAGGSLNYQWHSLPDVAAARHREELLQRAAAMPNIELRTSTLAAGCYADLWVALVDDKRLQKMRAKAIVMATGLFEQPALFRNNDLPGVMLATAAQRLIHQYAVKPFERAVVLTANPEGYRAALDLRLASVEVAAIVDLRPDGETGEARQAVDAAKQRVIAGQVVQEAIPGPGKQGITGVRLAHFDGRSTSGNGRVETIDCDGLVMSTGWAPADSLLCMAGGKMRYSDELQQFVPRSVPSGMFPAGRTNGIFELDAQIADGRRAGQAAAAHAGHGTATSTGAVAAAAEHSGNGRAHTHPYPVFPHPAGKVFVDLDEDVQYKDIVHAEQEGFDNIELLKRYSTFGMGPSQGKIANTNTTRILAKIRGQTVAETGSPTARPFFHPVPLSHLAGRSFHPHRLTSLHSRHGRLGAVFLPAGEWERPAYYRGAGRTQLGRDDAIVEEVRAVRQRLGIIDVGTLGKIEVAGPDAAEFLERIYTGRFASMKAGTTRYGLMCDESGVIIDDGVIGRLADDRFYATTTTTASSGVFREMQRWAILWAMRVTLTNVTGMYGAINLAGPESRRLLAGLTDLDLSESAFPYLGLRVGNVLDVPARLMRVGFVGELGYELHVPATWAPRLWDGLIDAGRKMGVEVRPFGVEAQRVLRLEKGHGIVGQDTDGLTHPHEAAMEWAVKMDKPFFVGQRSLAIVQRKPAQRRLVGFMLADGYAGELPKECHLVIDGRDIAGRVTSVTRSPTLGRVLGMAYVTPEQAAVGTRFTIRIDGGSLVEAEVVAMPFYDPKHVRQKAQ